MKPLETSSRSSPTFHFLHNPPLSQAPFFPSALGEDEALDFARICFSAAARALRWIEGICIGWGGESKRCEGEQESTRERCYCWGTANEGCREGRRDGEEKKGAYSHWSENSPILCPEDRRCCLPEVRVREEEGGLIYTCHSLHAHPFCLLCSSLQPSLSGAAEDCQPVQTKHKISAGRASAPTAPATLLYYSPSHIHTYTKCSHRHTFRELSLTRARLHPDKQARATPPSHYLCGEQLCSYWCERCGAGFRSSSAAVEAAAAAGQVQRRAISTRDHTSASTAEGKPPFFFTFPLSPPFSVFTWRSVADLPSFPSSPLSTQRVPVGQPWRTPSPAAMPPSPRCSDARDSSCKPVSSCNHTSCFLTNRLPAACPACQWNWSPLSAFLLEAPLSHNAFLI